MTCSRDGFLYIRGWMQMVITPNYLFSWNNRYNKYSVTNIFTHFLLELCTWTHSVHARILKPWRGSLPWLPAISSSCHVFPLPLSGLNWRFVPAWGTRSLSLQNGAPIHGVPAHSLTGIRNMTSFFESWSQCIWNGEKVSMANIKRHFFIFWTVFGGSPKNWEQLNFLEVRHFFLQLL